MSPLEACHDCMQSAEADMASITVRDVPGEIHRAFRARAVQNGRSLEAEIRDIRESAGKPIDRLKLGSALAAFGDKYGIALDIARDQEPAHDAWQE